MDDERYSFIEAQIFMEARHPCVCIDPEGYEYWFRITNGVLESCDPNYKPDLWEKSSWSWNFLNRSRWFLLEHDNLCPCEWGTDGQET